MPDWRLPILSFAVMAAVTVAANAGSSPGISPQAARLHRDAVVIDTHADTAQRLYFDGSYDIARRNAEGGLDIPRMREGGVDAQYFAIWVPNEITGPPAVKRALGLIDAVREAVRRHPQQLELATSAADIRRAASHGRIAVLIGIEGGHIIADDLGVLRSYAALGARYLTLTHYKNNNWADASTDTPVHDGLTAFGRDVVSELNRLGMMVDVSHVSDKTFYDVLATSRAPVIASHSSCREIDGHARNMSDGMLRALAANGGLIMITYEVSFLSEEYRRAELAMEGAVAAEFEAVASRCGDDEACSTLETARISRAAMLRGDLPAVRWEAIVDHIDHAVGVAGIDHVGLGSDFDGATMPIGMDDASMLPKVTDELLRRGYRPEDIRKILGGNLLRVLEQVERVAGGG